MERVDILKEMRHFRWVRESLCQQLGTIDENAEIILKQISTVVDGRKKSKIDNLVIFLNAFCYRSPGRYGILRFRLTERGDTRIFDALTEAGLRKPGDR